MSFQRIRGGYDVAQQGEGHGTSIFQEEIPHVRWAIPLTEYPR